MSIYDYFLEIILEGRVGDVVEKPLILVVAAIYLVASLIGRWKVFKKAGKTPWHSLIPVLSRYELYDIAWYGWIGLVVIAFQIVNILIRPASGLTIGAAAFIFFASFFIYFGLSIVMKLKMAKSFGKGIAFAFGLVFMEDMLLIVLGLDKSEYYGRTLLKYNPAKPKKKLNRRHKKRHYIANLTKHHSRVALIASVVVTACTFYAVVGGLTTMPSEVTPERGQNLFKLFTVNSNTLSAFGAAFLIPYAMEGIRNKRFVFPKWVGMFQYSGAICTTLTMVFAIAFIWPTRGAKLAFTGMNFWLHVLCPIMALVLLFSTESRYYFTVEDSLKALIPFYIYAAVYITNVVLIGEDMGGWRDIYYLTKFLPAEFTGPMMFMLGFGIASLMRYIYNRLNERRKEKMAEIWKKEDMDPIEANIEVYGIGRYIGLTNRESVITLPMPVFEDITEAVDVPMENLIQICGKGISEGLKESDEKKKRHTYWFNLMVGTPEFKAISISE